MKNKKMMIAGICLLCVLGSGITAVSASGKLEKSNHIRKQMNIVSGFKETEIEELEENKRLSSNDTKIYTDDENTVYCVEDGEVTGFVKKKNDKKVEKKQDAEIRIIADECMKELADGRTYTFSDMKYNEDTEMYSITYHKYIGEYKTADCIYLSLDAAGNLMAVNNPDKGEYDDVDVKCPTTEEINEFVKSKFAEKGLKVLGYSVKDLMIKKVDNQVKLEVVISYQKDISNIEYSDILYYNIDR